MKYAIMGYLGPTPTCMRPEAQVSTTDEASRYLFGCRVLVSQGLSSCSGVTHTVISSFHFSFHYSVCAYIILDNPSEAHFYRCGTLG